MRLLLPVLLRSCQENRRASVILHDLGTCTATPNQDALTKPSTRVASVLFCRDTSLEHRVEFRIARVPLRAPSQDPPRSCASHSGALGWHEDLLRSACADRNVKIMETTFTSVAARSQIGKIGSVIPIYGGKMR